MSTSDYMELKGLEKSAFDILEESKEQQQEHPAVEEESKDSDKQPSQQNVNVKLVDLE